MEKMFVITPDMLEENNTGTFVFDNSDVKISVETKRNLVLIELTNSLGERREINFDVYDLFKPLTPEFSFNPTATGAAAKYNYIVRETTNFVSDFGSIPFEPQNPFNRGKWEITILVPELVELVKGSYVFIRTPKGTCELNPVARNWSAMSYAPYNITQSHAPVYEHNRENPHPTMDAGLYNNQEQTLDSISKNIRNGYVDRVLTEYAPNPNEEFESFKKEIASKLITARSFTGAKDSDFQSVISYFGDIVNKLYYGDFANEDTELLKQGLDQRLREYAKKVAENDSMSESYRERMTGDEVSSEEEAE